VSVRNVVAYSLLVVGTVAITLTFLLESPTWPHFSAASVIGIAVGGAVSLALGLAVGVETRVPVGRVPALLSTQLFLAAAVLPSFQQTYSFSVTFAVTTLTCFIVLLSWVTLLGISNLRPALQLILVCYTILGGNVIAFWFHVIHQPVSLTGGLALLVAGPVLVGLLLPYIRRVFEDLVAIEERRVRPGPLPLSLQGRADAGSLGTLSLALAGLITILWLTVSVAPSLGFMSGEVDIGVSHPVLLAAILSVLMLLPLRQRARQHQRKICALASLVWLIGTTYSLMEDVYFHPLLLLPLVMASAWTWLTLTYTPVVIRNQSMPRRHLGLPALCVVSVMVGFYWAMTSGIYNRGRVTMFGWSFVAIFLSCAVSLALVVATGTVLARHGIRSPHRLAGPLYGTTRGLLQDHLLLSVQVLLLTWFPALVIAHVPASMQERLIAVILIVGGLVLFVSPLLFWTLRLHIRHTAFERHLRLRTPRLVAPYPVLLGPVLPTVLTAMRRCGPEIDEPINSDFEWCNVNTGGVNARNIIALVMASCSVVGLLGILNNYRD
jgi:hypothetical protein